jgi:short-chain fatty acids transporter
MLAINMKQQRNQMDIRTKSLVRFPTTFEIAIFLSVVAFVVVWLFSPSDLTGESIDTIQILSFWRKGFWELLEFTMQMILILVLGYALATSGPAQKLLGKLVAISNTNTKAVVVTGTTAILAGYLNWGFGLIVGAILARQIGQAAAKSASYINYPLVGASGYLGMLVWHGGLSASSSLKVAEEGHFLSETIGVIPISKTIFSASNLWINLTLVVALVTSMYFLSKRKFEGVKLSGDSLKNDYSLISQDKGMMGKVLGILILALCVSDFFAAGNRGLSFIDLNYVNLALMGLGFLVFGDVEAYFRAIARGLSASKDILVQFPFYAGILGMMKYSGFLAVGSEWFFQNVSAQFFPLMAFASASLVNLFIPSGGGQWAVQGPILMDAGNKLGINPADLILAFSYGDQVTNMLQPFWALPLLSITGIPARSLLKYTVFYFLVSFLVFSVGIYAFM